jgi:hypothetical protein
MTLLCERSKPADIAIDRDQVSPIGTWTIDSADSSVTFTWRKLRLWTVTARLRAPAFSRFVTIRLIPSTQPRRREHCFCTGQGRTVVNNDPDIALITRERRGPEAQGEPSSTERRPGRSPAMTALPNIVLVHGAWADGSSS